MVGVSLLDNKDKKYSENQNIIKLQNLSKIDSLDFLFVGNSYCYSGIEYSMFDSLDIRTFNLRIATAGPLFYKLIINDYISSVKKYPTYIFLPVSPTSFSNGSDNFIAYPIHLYLANPLSNFAITSSELRSIFLYPELMHKSYMKGVKNIFHFSKSEPENTFNSILNYKGYESSTIIVNDKIIEETENLYTPFKNDIISLSKYSMLLDIISQLEQKGIKIILFDLPSNKLVRYYNDEFNKTYENKIQELKKKHHFIS
jgi:hypothetical protein